MRDTARQFFDACESGKGWEVCRQYCHPDATFGAQADALAEVKTLEGYTEWMQGIYHVMPNASYEVLSFGADEETNTVCGFGVFRGTHTGEGGPVPPTGKSVEADYVYCMKFEDGRIRHMTKIWNDGYSLRQAGWAG